MVEAVAEVKEEVEEEAEDELQQHQQSQRDINMILARSRMKNRYWEWENWENKSLLTRENRRTCHGRKSILGIRTTSRGGSTKGFGSPNHFPHGKDSSMDGNTSDGQTFHHLLTR